jgi:hypothetical protein
MNGLVARIADELAFPAPAEVIEAARAIAQRLGGQAVLFYGSVRRTQDMSGVLDFYVLRDGPGPRSAIRRLLWPDVSYHEVQLPGRTIRAKVATMSLDTFERATRGEMLDTTIWSRFSQPASLIWTSSPHVRARVVHAVAEAVMTASRFAALLGPQEGSALDYWRALFRETYDTELRVEAPGRERSILDSDPDRYAALMPLAWRAAGIAHAGGAALLAPRLDETQCRTLTRAWLIRRQAGKPLNIARLFKAAFTFEGATRYALWKIERHTGLHFDVTPWRERHPILSAPGILWHVWRAAGQR